MTDETKQWESIRIQYSYNESVIINKEDLDKLEAISDVIDALQHGKALTEKLKNILK